MSRPFYINRVTKRSVLASLASAACLASPVFAVDRHWAVAVGTWSVAADWNPGGVPGSSDNAILDHFSNATAFVISNVGTPASVSISESDTVTVGRQGELGSSGDFIVGATGGVGTLNVTTNNPILPFPGFVSTPYLKLGDASGFGAVNQSAGTVSAIGAGVVVGSSRQAGSNFFGEGVYNLSGGDLDATYFLIGRTEHTAGTFNLGGGTANVGTLDMGVFSGSGTFSTGLVNQTGGLMNISIGGMVIGTTVAGPGTYTYSLSGGTLQVPGATYMYDRSLINYSGGTISVGNLFMNGGQVLLGSGGGKVFQARSLNFNTSLVVIDLNDNAMIVTQQSIDVVKSGIVTGFHGGDWNGHWITISAAAASLGAAHRTALGYSYASSAGVSTFFGRSVQATDVLVRYTYYGDANLDGAVDTSDFNDLAANFSGGGKYWSQGDFNYDGTVGTTDFNLLASNFGQTLAAQAASPVGALVPEPSAAALTVMFVAIVTHVPARRHRRQCRAAIARGRSQYESA